MTIVRFDIPDSLLSQIDLARPEYIDRKSFICCLIAKGLTGSDTLVERREELPEQGRASLSEASSSSSSSSIPKSINSKKSKSKGRNRGSYPEEFEAFWKAYQKLPEKASKQSKPLALTAWQEALESHSADDLLRAAQRQLDIQTKELMSGRGFTVAMPDCFRWLRDECYVALLENHKPSTDHVVEYL